MVDYSLVFVSIHCNRGPEAVPLGAASVASFVKQQFPELTLLNAYNDEPPRHIYERVIASVAPRIPNQNRVLGFSLYSWNRQLARTVAELYKREFPDSLLVAGGPEVSARPEGLSAGEGGPFTVLIQGEGETAFLNLLRSWSLGNHQDTELVQGSTEDLSSLPSPWLSGLMDRAVEGNPERKLTGRELDDKAPRHKEPSGALWELARGCPYACTYCYESKGSHRLRYISEDRFNRELEYFIEQKIPSVFVLDPTFNADNKRALQALDRILETKADIHWHFEVRAELLNRDQARRFAQLGASLQIGLQTADPEVSARVGRPLNQSKFKQKIDILNQEGVIFGLDLIYGLPGDTLKGFMESINFAVSLYPNHLDIFRLSVLPGTVLAEQAPEFDFQYQPEPPYELRSSATFTQEDLDRAERLARSADFFYNKGRAVPWFNQVLYPLHKSPIQFFLFFADFMDAKKKPWDANLDPAYPASREKLMLEFLDSLYEKQRLDYLLPAVWDVVRFHGAWARALAEGIETTIDCNYDPDQLIGGGIQDLEEFCTLADFNPCRIRVKPSYGEPEVSIVA